MLGDSYSEATGDADAQFPALLARKLCWSVVANGHGGTGYEADGQSAENEGTYGSRLGSVIEIDPDIVIVQGSTNDPGGQSTAAAADTVLSQLRSELPDADVIAVGPASPPGVSIERSTANRDAVRAAAQSADVPFIDALTWLDPAEASLWLSDDLHPTGEGHSLFATALANAIEDLGTVPTSCST
ncbi:SGNH/GDSL hydrolase family protein [Rhodococcus sp. IEGM 1381]|uniref:SGNH/GDSL hydrolase family protein n=1 Tax=Rhodococcus sp. IEGM 1381 TaxID=3047085 RepID=UPI0024B73F47|nr:SGNH/GDSL hydrolase family protein [Rhodococcus sp. IEGM 1381]MDI9894247.1 SGNH/GDSL hydrolase family protein [Rhodococcus sp. IEGM 1381]